MNPLYINQYKETFKLALPVCLGQLGHILVGVADSVMVGNYGEPGSLIGAYSLAAASLANGLYAVILVFGIGISYGVTPLVASADKNDTQRISGLLKHSLFICTLIGISLFVILFFCSPLLNFFDQPKAVVDLAIPYFKIMVLSMIPLMIFLAGKQFTEGLSFTKQAMYISIGANVLNVGFNYLFIYGNFGFPEMGLKGAGWASFISRVIMAITMLAYVYYSPSFTAFRPGFSIGNYSRKLLLTLLKIGIPTGMQFTFEVAAFAFAAVMMGWLGAKSLAAHQIAISVAAVTYMMASGISAAATVKVGNQLAAGNKKMIKIAGLSAIHLVIGFMACTAILFILLKNFLPSLFNQDAEVIHTASVLLVIAALFQLSDGIQVVAQGALRGLSDVKMPTVIAFIAYWIIGLPCAFAMITFFSTGPAGIWIGLLIGLTVSAFLLYRRFMKKLEV